MEDAIHPTHHVLVLEPDVHDAHRLCTMIRAVETTCELRVWHLDTRQIQTAVAPPAPDVVLLEADLSSEAELDTISDLCRTCDSPVVIITATRDGDRHRRALDCGVADCLIKWQFNEWDLARRLSNAIQQR